MNTNFFLLVYRNTPLFHGENFFAKLKRHEQQARMKEFYREMPDLTSCHFRNLIIQFPLQ
ncbi:hypothetical protein THRCLA_20995 [Thraustotheca clavata]|uniref:Uncharacterized protein n=1 Tax=Thraustotheca clavata TaxID=74557 RepID=A0A1W0A1V6_9STRA|nr:hypothetical protein THRCLA_20995 [Thraustotheca clavata]